MEQKDYLLREIEKIGRIMMAIRQKLFGGNESLAITLEKVTADLKEMLLNDANLDLEKLLGMDAGETDAYLDTLQGFSVENIELLAETLSGTGLKYKSTVFLEKALQLFEICSRRDRTYSFKRETNISLVKDALQDNA
ncbi:MAG: hypothetical protein JXR67_09325 [Bacteroidales bacterium]|nr:hypothetical protein [Bacteroidales bacterium]